MKKVAANLLPGENIYRETVSGGLNVYVMPRRYFNRRYAVLAVHCGSIDLQFREKPEGNIESVPEGIAHFIEHKLFEDKKENIFNKFAALGSSANAYTGFTKTAFLFSCTTNFFDSLLNLLNFVQEPYFTGDGIEREKSIIGQEIKMYEDDPEWRSFFNLLRGLYGKLPLNRNIAGSPESIARINKELLLKFYNTFYRPGNMVLFITGDVDKDKMISLINENQLQKELPPAGDVEKIYPEEPETVNRKIISETMNVSRPIFNLGFKERVLPDNPDGLLKQETATNILLEILLGRSSPVYEKLEDEDLIDDTFSFNYSCQPHYGFVRIRGATGEPEELCGRLMEELQNSDNYLNEETFERIRKKFRGNFISKFNSFAVIASEFIDLYFRGSSIADKLNLLNQINIEDIRRRYRQIINSNYLVKSIVKNG